VLRVGNATTMTIPSFGRTSQRFEARSRTRLAQVPVGSPFLAAASSYAFLRPLVSRISRRSFSGSSMGGLPRGRFFGCSMSLILVRTNNLHKHG
jgi:hypothetical protein